MFDKLEQLRSKPPHIKKRIAFGVSAGITAVILVFWFTSLGVTIQNQQVAELNGDVYVNQNGGLDQNGAANVAGTASNPDSATAATPTPVAALTASVSNAFAPVGALLKSFVTDLSSAAQPPATTSAVEIYAAPTIQDASSQSTQTTGSQGGY